MCEGSRALRQIPWVDPTFPDLQQESKEKAEGFLATQGARAGLAGPPRQSAPSRRLLVRQDKSNKKKNGYLRDLPMNIEKSYQKAAKTFFK